MKKILLSSYSLDIGGIETALITLIKHIHKDYDITLVLEKKEGVFLEELPSNVKVIEYTPNNNKIRILRKAINFVKQIKFRNKYKDKYDFSGCFATYSYSSSFVARTTSKNSALWVHNDFMNFYNNDKNQYKNFFKKLKVDKYKKIIFVSENDKKVFLEQFPEYVSNCEVCNNLINYQKIMQKSEEKIDDIQKDEIPTFINLGRHEEKQKKLSRIIEATKRLNNEGYKFRIIFIGDGEDSEGYKKLAKNIHNITFLGAKKNPYPYLKQSECLLISSDYEGYPVVFIESLILGKPIITTDVSDSKKDIKDKYGIVVEKSTDGIYNGMKEFLEKGFNIKEFNPEEYNNEIIKKLKKIIEDKN